jgi:hypothetical protein
MYNNTMLLFSKLLLKFKRVHWDDNNKIYPTYSADEYDRTSIKPAIYNKKPVKQYNILNYFTFRPYK